MTPSDLKLTSAAKCHLWPWLNIDIRNQLEVTDIQVQCMLPLEKCQQNMYSVLTIVAAQSLRVDLVCMHKRA